MVNRSNNLALQETNRALDLAGKGRNSEAYVIYRQLADRIPDDLETKVQFANLSLTLGRVESAIEIYNELTEEHPDNGYYFGMLGNAYVRAEQFQDAERAYLKSIELDPTLWMAYADLGSIYNRLDQNEKAIPYLEKAIELKPSNAESHANLSVCLIGVGRLEEAIRCGKKAIKLDPKNQASHDCVGCALAELGKLTEAIPFFEKAIALDNTVGSTYLNFSKIKKFSEADRPFIEKIEKQLKTSLPAKQRANFEFALGKIYDDCKQFDKAFMHYKQANLLAKTHRPEPPDIKHMLKLLRKVFSQELMNKAPEIGDNSNIPVFIVGMPRSGTSLIEQIISRHSKASGAGELDTIHYMADDICLVTDRKNYVSEWRKHLNKNELHDFAQSYLEVLRKHDEQALRITDKLPENFLYLGFIHLLFPNAKIIHSIRNPMDVSLSCFFQPFTTLHWTYDLEWIAKRYQLYRQFMNYWKSVFPPGIILDVNYESLIENQEQESRRMIAHCGLDWEDGCLDFNKENRVVATASLWQVRQPIYKSSVKRWMNYAPYLKELANSLSEFLDSDDLESLKQAGIKVKSKRWW